MVNGAAVGVTKRFCSEATHMRVIYMARDGLCTIYMTDADGVGISDI